MTRGGALVATFLLLAALLTFAGCQSTGSMCCSTGVCPACSPKTSLYERLGGEKAIVAVVDDFVARTAANPAVNFTRKGTTHEFNPTPENMKRLKMYLVQYVSMVTGGPRNYQGRDMKTVHAGMKISEAEFNAMAADLVASLDKFNVPGAEKDEFMALAASTRSEIVGQ